jgi:poly(3-hydroxybutyrate) depolymerase
MSRLGPIAAAILLASTVPVARAAPPARAEVAHGETPVHKMPLSWYIPASSADKESVPLVLSYHGKGGTNAGEIGGWVALAEKHGFVVACPKSYFAGGDRPADDKRPLGPIRELEDAVAVVQMLEEKRGIDERFIMATGFSGGGLPSYTAGLLRPDMFRFVCSRCGNFPAPIIAAARQQAATQPQLARSIDAAVANVHFYFFYGEKDHPVILQIDAPRQLQFFEAVKAPHFTKEMVPGMGHDSRPDKAAEWFVGEIAAALAAGPAAADGPRKQRKQPAAAAP